MIFEMKKLLGAASIAVLMTWSIIGCDSNMNALESQVTTTDWDRDSIETVVDGIIDDQVDAWNNGDVEGFMAGYWRSDQLRFVAGKTVLYGHDSMTAMYKRSYPGKEKMGELRFDIRDKKWMGDSLINVLGRWNVTNNDTTRSGNFAIMFMPVSEGWRIVEDHTW